MSRVSGGPRRWSDRLQALPTWVLVALIGLALVLSWAVVYALGGTHTVWPHLFYGPIVLAALPFGLIGGVLAGSAAMLLSGPLMPLDVAAGEPQQLVNWLARGGFFVAVGALAGAARASLRQRFESDLAAQLRGELDEAAVAPGGVVDARWTQRVRDVLTTGEYEPVFQPVYALDDGRLLAVEALTRFGPVPHIPPNVWFEHAHRAGLGIDLELATLGAALDASCHLDEQVALSFNASPELLLDRRLGDLLDRRAGRRLIVEVTEHAIIDDYRAVVAALRKLRAGGVRVAVDDAGAGFASLRHIVRLEPDLIKLDPSLTQDLGDDPIRRPLAAALLQFAERTGSQIVVEGIETASDLHTWCELGAHAAQGYLLARPGPLPFPDRFGAVDGSRRQPVPRHQPARATAF